jgi:hypothetical protein
MKQNQHITFNGPRTTPTDVCRWAQELVRLHARLAPRFARPEPRRRMLAYLQGILSDTSRKNGWQLAEHAREARPDGMQRLLASAVWDTDGVRDDLRSYALEQLGQESAILVIDETSFAKRGQQSAGVGVQYCGTTGQVGVPCTGSRGRGAGRGRRWRAHRLRHTAHVQQKDASGTAWATPLAEAPASPAPHPTAPW